MTAGNDPARVTARLFVDILRDCGHSVGPETAILDFGCGNGAVVRALLDMGLDARGCDLRFKPGPDTDALAAAGRICLIAPEPYRLPFPDASFGFLISSQVLEHVRDYPGTLAEMKRVLKPGGACLHIFPSRLMPIEPHIRVPLATVIQSRPWLLLWSAVGLRGPGQQGMGAAEVAQANQEYLLRATNYLPGRRILDHFQQSFQDVRWAERSFLKHTPHRRGRLLHTCGKGLPFLFALYRVFWSRVIIAA